MMLSERLSRVMILASPERPLMMLGFTKAVKFGDKYVVVYWRTHAAVGLILCCGNYRSLSLAGRG